MTHALLPDGTTPPRWPRRLATVALVALCWGLGLICVGIALDKYPDVDAMTPRQDAFVGLDILAGTLACALLPLVRSRHPRRAGVAALAVAATSLVSSFGIPALCHLLVTVGSWRDRRWLAAVDLVAVAGSIGYSFLVPDEQFSAGYLPLVVAVVAALNLWGLYRGSRRALVASQLERAEVLRREHTARLAQVRAEERSAIAREMHDTLSHRLAVISLHAGGLSVRPDLGAERVEQAAALIQRTAQEASEELRSLLTVLRTEACDSSEPLTLASLDELLDDARTPGSHVMLQLDETLRSRLDALAPQASGALAHAVREGLANAMKHAPGRPVQVVLADDGEGLLLTVTSPLGAAASPLAGGYGLVGLAERLAMAGGWLRHGVDGGAHRLEAWVPWS